MKKNEEQREEGKGVIQARRTVAASVKAAVNPTATWEAEDFCDVDVSARGDKGERESTNSDGGGASHSCGGAGDD